MRRPLLGIVLIVILAALALPAAAQTQSTASTAAPATSKALFFASDGMRPDLMERYAAAGAMPTYKALMRAGVKGDNGLVQGFPPNTGVGWPTLATGTWPSEHGSTNNTFHRVGEADFNNRTSAYQPNVLQAQTIAQAAEQAGKTVVSVEWVGTSGLDPALNGPVVDFRTSFSDTGVLTNFDLPGQPEGAERFGVSYQRQDLRPAEGWTNVPESFSPAMEQQLVVTTEDEE